MKLVFLKNLRTALFLFGPLVFLATSCSKTNGLLDSDTNPVDSVIPSNPNLSAGFNWATTKSVDLRVAVDDQYNDQFFYKLEIFDKEPHLEGATLLGAGLAKKSQDLLTKIQVPTGLSHVFVQKTTPIGEVSYSILNIPESAKVNSNKVSSITKVATINTIGFLKVASTTPVSPTPPTVPSVPSSAMEIGGKENVSTVPASKAYVIRSGHSFAGNINALASEGVTVYVQGKWHHLNAIELGSTSKIVVLPGGELNVASINMNNGTASLDNFGDLLLKSLKLEVNNAFKNVGTLKITGAVTMKGNAEFVNYQKDVKVKIGSLSMPDDNCVVTNNGELEILSGSFINGTLNANCYTTVGQMVATNATVNIWSDAMLDVTNLQAEGTDFNLYARAVLDVTNRANFKAGSNGNAVVINSIGSDASNKSYVRIKYVRVDASNTNHLTYNGHLIVVTDEHPARSENRFTTGESNTAVEIFWDRYNHPPYVAATSCNNGGAGTIPSNPPVDQTLQEVKLGTYSYLFEDNWPNVGDYDMNDMVLNVEIIKYQNKSNQIEKVVLKNKIFALGATRRMGAAIQLDNVLAGAIKSVTYSNNDVVGTKFPLVAGVGIESNQTKAVVAIVDDAHAAFGLVNTGGFVFTHNGVYAPFESQITIVFNTPLSSFSFNDLNPFIVSTLQSAAGKRHEVHLVGFAPTDKIDTKIISDNQASGLLNATDPYKTVGGWPYAIVVPMAEFRYQRNEGQHISVAYPRFMDWVNSGGTVSSDWYNHPKN